MKLSNLFIFIAGLTIIGFYISKSIPTERYVTKQEYERNAVEGVASLEADSYHLVKQLFDQPFNEIVLKDTGASRSAVDIPYLIQWVKSETSGLKKTPFTEAITNIVVENNKVICYLDHKIPSAEKTLIFYSPSLEQITVDNAGHTKLRHTTLDSLRIYSRATKFEMEETTSAKKLTIQADTNSILTIKTRSIDTANYRLSWASVIRSQVDTCRVLNIVGDSSNTVYISPLKQTKNPADSRYGTVTYNNAIGSVVIENIIPNQVRGNKDQLTLHLPVRQIERLLAKIR